MHHSLLRVDDLLNNRAAMTEIHKILLPPNLQKI